MSRQRDASMDKGDCWIKTMNGPREAYVKKGGYSEEIVTNGVRQKKAWAGDVQLNPLSDDAIKRAIV